MNVSRIFILRPIATSLLMLALLIGGALAYRLLPIAALPEVDYPTIVVTTLYPGASPEVMTSHVTAPLERQLGQIPGLAQMSSTSSGGASVITLRFSLSTVMSSAEQQVQAAINAASNLLPNDLPMPPLYHKVNPADAPILTLAVTSPSLSVIRLNDLVENRLAPKLSQVQGVGLVAIAGGRRPAVRIQANPSALAALGLTLEDVRSTITSANVKAAKGSFDGPLRASSIDANDQLQSAAQYRDLIIAFKNGLPVRLSDVATTVDDAENTRLSAWAATPESGVRAGVIVHIRRQPHANVIETVDRLKALLPQLQDSLPASLDVQILTDRTVTIRASVRDMQMELLVAIGLVVAVIFVFLRNVWATLIPSIAVPLSLVGTLACMHLAGFSINNLTLMALTISTGFVVDDAIVMIENIARHVEDGMPALPAALVGAQQIGFTIISLTISLVAVLIPLLFMGDVVGRLFHEFALTMAVSIVLSAVISLTLTPMLCARLLRPKDAHAAHTQPHRSGFFDALLHRYGHALRWVLAHRRITWAAFGATLVVTLVLYHTVAKGFFPTQDTGTIVATTQADQAISFTAMAHSQHALVQQLLSDTAVRSISSFIGVDESNPTLNTGRLLIDLKPHGQRDTLEQVLRRLQDNTRDIPGIRLYAQPVQDLSLEERAARTQYQLLLSSPDAAALAQASDDMMQRLQQLPQLQDVGSDQQTQGRQLAIEIDRASASRLGVSVAAIDTALYNAFGQRQISTIFTQSNQYRVVLEVAPAFQQGPQALHTVYVARSNGGAPVPLSAIASFSERSSALSIHHVGQLPAVTLSFNTAPSVALSDAVAAIQAHIATARATGQLPPSVEASFEGAALAFEKSLTNTVLLVLAAVVTMYIVLGVLYESTLHPITILSTLPSAALGALLALQLYGLALDIIAVIGIILLIGIVKKNAIMMIDFALEAQRQQGLSAHDAIYQACLLRFRPILMTTLAALLGALPLMLGQGVGSELRHPLGVTMVGGLILSQLLTLFTTPVIYLTFEDWAQRWRARRTPSQPAPCAPSSL